VLDDATGRPLAGTLVELVDISRQHAFDRAMTDERGAFTLDVPAAGSYRLHANGVRYVPIVTEPFPIEAGQRFEFVVRLDRNGIVRGAVVLEEHQPPGMSERRKALERRIAQGRGAFITGDALKKGRGLRLLDLVSSVPGVRVSTTFSGDPVVRLSHTRPAHRFSDNGSGNNGSSSREEVFAAANTCPPTLLMNGAVFVTSSDRYPLADVQMFHSLAAAEIEAVEVYRDAADVPREFPVAHAQCGVIAVWTLGSID
jgi:hypothetical protein